MTAENPLADPVAEGNRIVEAAVERDLTVKKIGGTAIHDRSETVQVEPFKREYRDVDFVGHRAEESEVEDFMVEMGYEANERFNTMRPSRLEFVDPENERKADFILDKFRFSHEWSLKNRLDTDHDTVPIEDLLLSKLQIAEISDRDMRDIIALLNDHDVEHGGTGGTIDADYVADLCRSDWGLYKTLSINLGKVWEYLHENDLPVAEAAIEDRLATLESAIESVPKTLRWKLRSLIGERKQWYRKPELS
ncbi:hypothetical protein [Halodesulfurarchaeum sp.]|uniref:hypothetical protein n=1 Tax=Halodesulfurarchaeum sp. TaxID=1980530 RepID=UPI001BBD4016|nr:hypothetical protein [Halodesulfurarchaeum sp.]